MKFRNPILFSLLILFISINLSTFANGFKKQEKKKSIHKTFKVGPNDALKIKNKFGKVNITTWHKNEIVIDIQISVKSNNEEVAEQKFESIDVIFEQGSNALSVITKIESHKSFFGYIFKKSSVEMTIDYEVKMPITNELDLKLSYGNAYLDRLEGPSSVEVAYGGFNIGQLLNEQNEVSLEYGTNSNINYVYAANVNAEYSKLNIEEAVNLICDAEYSDTSIGYVKKLDLKLDYGGIQIDEVDEVNVNSDYVSLAIGTIHKNLKCTADYGVIKIENLDRAFELVDIVADYTSVKIYVDEATSFDFDTQTSYAGISFDGFIPNFTYKEDKMSDKKYKGRVGSNPSGMIQIHTEYGGIKILKN